MQQEYHGLWTTIDISSDFTAQPSTYYRINTTVNSVTVTLPDPATVFGQGFRFKKLKPFNQVTITSATLIDGSNSLVLLTAPHARLRRRQHLRDLHHRLYRRRRNRMHDQHLGGRRLHDAHLERHYRMRNHRSRDQLRRPLHETLTRPAHSGILRQCVRCSFYL